MKAATVLSTVALSTVAILSMGAQPAQAGFVAIIAIGPALIGAAGKAIGTAVRESNKKNNGADTNDAEETVALHAIPPGTPGFEFERCYADIADKTVTINTNHVEILPLDLEIKGLPATCMNLAAVLIGDGTGPFPVTCGSDCLVYNNLTAGQIVEFQNALGI